MNDRATYDAIVVGSRAAGAATAMLLARLGRSVLVVDRSRYGSDTLSTHALMRAGTLQLHRWGVLGDVMAAGTPPVRRTVFHYDDGDVDVSIKPAGGVDALYAPRRTVLDAHPRRRRRARRRRRSRFGTTVTDLVHADEGRVVGVGGHDRGGDALRRRAPLTIGADGIHSVVARLVDAPLRRSAAGREHARLRLLGRRRRRRLPLVLPSTGGRRCDPHERRGRVCVRQRSRSVPSDAGAAPRSLFDRTVARVAPEVAERLAGAPSSAGYRMFAGPPGWMRRPFGPGWALVGDAGYFKDPISRPRDHGRVARRRAARPRARAARIPNATDGGVAGVRRATRRALGAAVRDDRRHRPLPLGHGRGPAAAAAS